MSVPWRLREPRGSQPGGKESPFSGAQNDVTVTKAVGPRGEEPEDGVWKRGKPAVVGPWRPSGRPSAAGPAGRSPQRSRANADLCLFGCHGQSRCYLRDRLRLARWEGNRQRQGLDTKTVSRALGTSASTRLPRLLPPHLRVSGAANQLTNWLTNPVLAPSDHQRDRVPRRGGFRETPQCGEETRQNTVSLKPAPPRRRLLELQERRRQTGGRGRRAEPRRRGGSRPSVASVEGDVQPGR